jgi:hypothetical protein
MKTSVKDIDFGVNKAKDSKVPVFLGHSGIFYDLHYTPIDKEALANGRTPLRESSFSTPHYDPTINITNCFPQPDLYESFFDYEQALLDWKLTVETALGGIRLPNAMGRKFSRPRVGDHPVITIIHSLNL